MKYDFSKIKDISEIDVDNLSYHNLEEVLSQLEEKIRLAENELSYARFHRTDAGIRFRENLISGHYKLKSDLQTALNRHPDAARIREEKIRRYNERKMEKERVERIIKEKKSSWAFKAAWTGACAWLIHYPLRYLAGFASFFAITYIDFIRSGPLMEMSFGAFIWGAAVAILVVVGGKYLTEKIADMIEAWGQKERQGFYAKLGALE
jgi:hypothetical protein